MSSLDLELPFGLNGDGRMVAVADVERGLACNCRCPQCNRRLVAKKGEILRWHFAHESDADCKGAFESMLHRLAKQIVADHGVVRVPVLTGFHAGFPVVSFEPHADVELSNVRLESWQGGFRPDAIATRADDQTEIVIEVMVSHACEPAKLELLRTRDIAAIEIDLSGYHSEVGVALLTDLVLRDGHRIWLHHPRQAQADAAAAAYVGAQKAELARREAVELEARRAALAAQRAYQERLAAERWEADAATREATDTVNADRCLTQLASERRHAAERRYYEVLGEAWDLERQEREKIAASERAERQRQAAEERRIAAEERRQQEAAERRRTAAVNAGDLQGQAVRTFRSTDYAELWMRTTHPKLGFKRPSEVCGTPDGLTQCLAILQTEGRRKLRPQAFAAWKQDR